MLEDTDFEFPKGESELDRIRVEWNNLTNDKEKRRYCNELEELVKSLEVELDWKNKDIDKLNKKESTLGGYLITSIIFGICGWCGFYITNN